MEYKDIDNANRLLVTTDVKGKAYVEVNQRIKAFRMLYPEGYIEPQVISNQEGVCVMKVEVGHYEQGEKRVLGIGHAYEKEDGSYINKTSYIENCETSAVGRALGMLGIGIDTSVASAEEMEHAVQQQEGMKPINQATIRALRELFRKNGIDEAKVLVLYKIGCVEEMTNKMHVNLINHLDQVKKECGI
ncbi:hypothetical protein LQE92_08950 [Lacrimispora sp. NSJ-141]|uniref:Uncharacterized protein n=1 Tax=Lientehia hominis TaxID=2897778 RepID=A0AAP2RJH0_9FIRM|nr:hypothetical protein [Lientehia hominis]MCD2492755.1 hypothetical protein [Lientehia hominis]